MKMFRRTVLTTLSAAALVASMGAVAQDIKPRLIRFGYGLNEQSNQGRAVKVFAEEVEKLSGGKMKLRAVGAAALGPDVQMQQALIGGAQEMMVGSTATLVGITKEMALWDTPFLFNSAKEADIILDGPIGQKVMDKLQEKGLVGLVYWENGFRNLTNSQRPVTKMEDLNGVKLRVMQNPVYLDAFKTLGANAIPLPFSELFTALETKTVDGQENPYNTILSSKFYEVQKYLSVTNHVYSPWIVLVSKKWWDQLSKAEQKVLLDAAKVSREFERKDTRAEAGRALNDLKGKGMQINELSAGRIRAHARQADQGQRRDRRQRRHGPLERDQDRARKTAQVRVSGERAVRCGQVAAPKLIAGPAILLPGKASGSVDRGSGFATAAGPIGMEVLTARPVNSLILMRAKKVSLSLQQVRGEVSTSVAVIEGQCRRQSRRRNATLYCLYEHISQRLLRVRNCLREKRIKEQILEIGIPVKRLLYLSEKSRTNDAATPPY